MVKQGEKIKMISIAIASASNREVKICKKMCKKCANNVSKNDIDVSTNFSHFQER